MLDQNQAKHGRRRAYLAGLFATSIRRPALALICCLLAGCAVSGSGPAPMAEDQSAPPKAEPAAKQSGGIVSETKTLASDSMSVQRRRQAIADMIEDRTSYVSRWVEGGAARLTDAKFAGPFEYTRKDLFAAPVTETVYCAKV